MSILKVIAAATAGLFLVTPEKADAYPIDCAILLCLSGGWPSSAECSAARFEFIRRITPFPIEPPLQIWRCPMGVSYNAPAQTNFTSRIINATTDTSAVPTITPAILTSPEELAAQVILAQQADVDISSPDFDFVRSIRVWNITYNHRERGKDEDCGEQGSVLLGLYGQQGDYSWEGSTFDAIPAWVGMPRSCHPETWFRGVAVEWRDHGGNHGYEVVRY